MTNKKVVVACALGECVHVAGVVNFLCLAAMSLEQFMMLLVVTSSFQMHLQDQPE